MPYSPVGIPGDAESDDVFIREESPQKIEKKEEIGRCPCHEAVEFWGPAADFRRGQRRIRCQRTDWRSGVVVGPFAHVWGTLVRRGPSGSVVLFHHLHHPRVLWRNTHKCSAAVRHGRARDFVGRTAPKARAKA